MSTADIVTLEGGWNQIQRGGIDRLEAFLETGAIPADVAQTEGKPRRIFAANDYANLYTLVYNMCTQRSPHNWAEQLYRRYGESLSRYIQQRVFPALSPLQSHALLRGTLSRWTNHKIYVKWLDRFFAYLDRYYVKLQSVDPLTMKGILIFRSLVFEPLKANITTAMLELIHEEREGMEGPSDLPKGLTDMMVELGVGSSSVYVADLEEPILPTSAAYYSRQAAGWLTSATVPEYCILAERCFQTEERRVQRYLQPSTWPRLKGVLITTILQTPQQAVLDKPTGVLFLLSNDRLEDLKRLYSLFSMVEGGLLPISTAFRSFVSSTGNAIVDAKTALFTSAAKSDALTDPSLVEELINLHDKYRSVVLECFGGDSLFQRALKDAFESFMNREIGKYTSAAFLSSYSDRLLKKSGERLSDEQVDVALGKVVDLFAYLTDKDMFAEIYRNQLSKRLLQETSASEDAEKSLIQKLKLKCGAQFCTKLEGMLADMRLAVDTQREFKDSSTANPFDFSVLILTTGFWPTYLPAECILPLNFQVCLDSFSAYYQKKTDHRKIVWIHALGMVSLVSKFGPDNRKYDIVMSTYQALIMLLFNSHDSLSVGDLFKLTGIEEGFLKRLLATLVISKFKLLNRTGSNPKAVESDEFLSVNNDFNCPSRRIKLPPPTAASEETFSKERVEEDRTITIQAAIVRIMKTRKTLNHQQLVSELLTQLSFFRPNPKAIKQQIEALIEREYLERDPKQQNVYNYLA